jgi:small-conductance mechanosensitive channel
MKAFLFLLCLVCAEATSGFAAVLPAAPHPAAPPPAAPVLTPAQAQGVLDVLQNDKKRAQFIAVLQNMAKVQTAIAPHAAGVALTPGGIGAEVLATGAAVVARAAHESLEMARTLTRFGLLRLWFAHLIGDPVRMGLLADAAWKLMALGGAAALAAWLTRRWLARFRTQLNESAPAGSPQPGNLALLRRVPLLGLRLVVDLAPVAVFATVIYAALATPLGDVATSRLIVLGFANAAISVLLGMVIMRALLAPHASGLRLIQMSDASAAYLTRWARRFLVLVIFGHAVLQTGLLFGLYQPLHDALVKLLALVVHLLALIVVLECRTRVTRRLRAPAGAHGAWAMARNRFAELWYVIAAFYLIALWLVFAFEVPRGYTLIWHWFVVIFATLIVARLLAIVLLGALDRLLAVGPDTIARYPGIDVQARRYQSLLHRLVSWAIALVAFVVLLRLFGVSVSEWVRPGTLGGRLASAFGTSLLVVLLAIAVWEAVNVAIEAHLARLARDMQLARSARLRTLLPMLRTTLLVVIFVFAALMVLSQIGVNTAPLLAGAGVVGIAIGFGSQKLVQDVITGLFLLLENTVRVGDTVSLASLTGTVETLSVRTIRLRAVDGAVHVVPFSAVTTVTNSTRDYAYAVLDVEAGYNEEPDHIAAVLREVADEVRQDPHWAEVVVGEMEILGVDRFLDNAWVLRARIKTTPTQRSAVQREFNRRLKYRFDHLAIESPFTSPRILSTHVTPEPPPSEETAP